MNRKIKIYSVTITNHKTYGDYLATVTVNADQTLLAHYCTQSLCKFLSLLSKKFYSSTATPQYSLCQRKDIAILVLTEICALQVAILYLG